MKILHITPLQDGFYMPAEFAPHEDCLTVLCSEGQYDNARAQLPDLCHPRRRRERPAVCAFQAETGHYVGRLEELAFNQGG